MIQEINHDGLKEVLETRRDLIVVKFGATWCAACKAIQPAVNNIANQFPGVRFFDMDADKNTDYVIGLGVKSLPSFAFYKNGELLTIEKGLTQVTLEQKTKELF